MLASACSASGSNLHLPDPSFVRSYVTRTLAHLPAHRLPSPAVRADYHTAPGRNYEETMIDVASEARRRGLPYRYYLVDSWLYSKGRGGGVHR